MNLKKISILFFVVVMVLTGCKCHRDSKRNSHNQSNSGVVQIPAPEFSVDDVWVLASIRGKQVEYLEGQHKATAHFNNEAGTVDGHNGCNQYHASFKDHGEGKMTIGMISQTKMACPEPFHKIEFSFMQLLAKCDGYKIDAYTLDLLIDGKVVLSFVKDEQ